MSPTPMPSPATSSTASGNAGATVSINPSSSGCLKKTDSSSEPISEALASLALGSATTAAAAAPSLPNAAPARASAPSPRRPRYPPAVLRLNVGGERVELSRGALLEREPRSLLACLVRYSDGDDGGGRGEGEDDEPDGDRRLPSCFGDPCAPDSSSCSLKVARDESGALFVDGDGRLFKKFVLPYLRFGAERVIPLLLSSPCAEAADDRARLALEADYLQLEGLASALALFSSSSPPSSSCLSSSCPPPHYSSLWLPAEEARARAAAAGPEGALDEALCERGGRLLSALELVLSLARGWILSGTPSDASSTGGGDLAATTLKPPLIVCRLRGKGICHVARPGCFDAFVEEGVVSCGGSSCGPLLSSSSAAVGLSAATSSASTLATSVSNASALVAAAVTSRGRLLSTLSSVEREVSEISSPSVVALQLTPRASSAAVSAAAPPSRTTSALSSLSSLSSSTSSAEATTAAAASPPGNTSESQQQQQRAQTIEGRPTTCLSYSRELEPELDAPIMIGGSYDRSVYAPPGSGVEWPPDPNDNSHSSSTSSSNNVSIGHQAEKNRIVYAALSSTPLEDPREAAIKEAVLALAERPALVRALLVRRFGFSPQTTVRASMRPKVSWRPSKTYGSADVFEVVQATCVIDLAMSP